MAGATTSCSPTPPRPRTPHSNGNGELEIRAEKSSDASLPCWNEKPCAYTSARLISQGKRTFTYGKLEARIQVPGGAGIWPAFWALGEGSWPNAGEIDVMEFVGKTPNLIYGTAHGPGYSGAQGLGNNTQPRRQRARQLSRLHRDQARQRNHLAGRRRAVPPHHPPPACPAAPGSSSAPTSCCSTSQWRRLAWQPRRQHRLQR